MGLKIRGNLFYEIVLMTFCSVLFAVGNHFFRFPNNFTFGGVTGLAVVLQYYLPISTATINFIISNLLLVVGFLVLGRGFGAKTAYVSITLSVFLSALEKLCPLEKPLTDQPILELCYGIALPGLASALLFYIGASGGGTDIVAMLLKKYTSIDIGRALFFADALIVASAFFTFGIQVGLYSVLGLVVKSFLVDTVIENINRCKSFNIICSNPEPICQFIMDRLHHSATVYQAQGAFTHAPKTVIITVMSRPQAAALRAYIKSIEPTAFMIITNSSEIIGKGFQN